MALAYTSPGRPTGLVSDYAELLDDGAESALEAKLEAFRSASGNEIAVVTIPSLQGDTVENFAEKLFQEWGIGSQKNDNGVLILVSREDRAVRIEVGYGLEGALTDAQSSWIIREELAPAFREEAYGAGLNAAVDRVIAATQGEYVPEDQGGGEGASGWGWLVWLGLFAAFEAMAATKSWWLGGVLGAVAGVAAGFLWSVTAGVVSGAALIALGLGIDYLLSKNAGSRSGRSGWWAAGGHGSGGSGGFGGFGGGSSGGGGASGDW
jgi:uncharacterized protein